MSASRAWCSECGRRVFVEDEFPESRYTPGGEMERLVTVLVCGHSQESSERRVGDAPGAPYAGPDRPVARSTRPDEMRAARPESAPVSEWEVPRV